MKSDSIDKLAIALSQLQASLTGAKKDTVNPFFKSKYADLESVWEAVRKPLADNGLAVTQTMECVTNLGDPLTVLVTTLMHTSGQYISGSMPLLLKTQDPQGQGSAITYARRYALAAILGVHQTDDDAERAMETVRQQPRQLLKPSAKPTLKSFLPTDEEVEKKLVDKATLEAFSLWADNQGVNKDALWTMIAHKYPSLKKENFFKEFNHKMMGEIAVLVKKEVTKDIDLSTGEVF